MVLDAAAQQSLDLRCERYSPQIAVSLARLFPDRATEVTARLR